MNESLLIKVGDSVKQYASVISNVLQLDVDIADNNLYRIAGTGRFNRMIDKRMDVEGNAFREVVRTKKHLYIEDASKDKLCSNCGYLEVCRDQSELCCPIIARNEVIGVISLSSANDEQKRQIADNFSHYLSFLNNIADLIATKAIEYQNDEENKLIIELLYKLINLINDGVIVFDTDNDISFMNKKTEKLFGYKISQLKYLSKIKKFSIYKARGDNDSHNVEYVAKINEKKIRLLGKDYPISTMSKKNITVFIFQDVESIQQNLLNANSDEIHNLEYLISKNEQFNKVKEQCGVMANSNTNILIYGEPGTGKEMVARLIHNESMRRNKPFIRIACRGSGGNSILGQSKIGSGEFNNEESGFGKIALSSGGTLYLDEIGDMSMRVQGKFADIISNKLTNTRIIAATNKNLKYQVQQGFFREDLYNFLETFAITVPPLRSRREDIKLLTNHFLEKYNIVEGKKVSLNKEVYKLFEKYSWIGNVRELENIVSFLVLSSNADKVISVDDIPEGMKMKLINNTIGKYNLEKIEKETIVKALNAFGNSPDSKKIVAKELGISKATLYRKLQKYNIIEKVHYN